MICEKIFSKLARDEKQFEAAIFEIEERTEKKRVDEKEEILFVLTASSSRIFIYDSITILLPNYPAGFRTDLLTE